MATYTAATAIPTGGLITSAWLTQIPNAINLLGAGGQQASNKDIFYARQGTAQSIGTSIIALTFGGEDIDTAGGHDTNTNTSRYVIQTSGKYRMAAGVACPALSSVDVTVALRKNGAASVISGSSDTVKTSNIQQLVNTPITYQSLVAGDYVELVAYGSSTFNTIVTGPQSWFAVEWIGV